MKRTDFELGLILGLCLPPVPQVTRGKLVGYSYNGIRLPAMDFDPATYDYFLYGGSPYYMRRSAAGQKFICDSDNNVDHKAYAAMASQATKWSSDDTWTAFGGMYPLGVALSKVLWSYNDILYEDGTVAFKGSKPVPVYA